MKLKHTLSLLALASCAAVSTSVLAQANVNFEGRILDTICTGLVVGDGGTVRLSGALVNELSAPGNTAKRTEFPVTLSGCDTTTVNYQANFSHGSVANGRLLNQGTATGVSLQLLSSNDTVLAFTTAPDTSRIPPGQDPGANVGTAGSIIYKVQYYRESAPLNAGTVNANATVTLTFL